VKHILKISREKQQPPARVADQYAESELKPGKTHEDMNWGVM
jgi:hypothetical protein